MKKPTPINFKNTVLAIVTAGVLSIGSLVSSTAWTTVALTATAASFTLTTDVYARKSKDERKKKRRERLIKRLEKAREKGQTNKTNRLNNKIWRSSTWNGEFAEIDLDNISNIPPPGNNPGGNGDM